MQKTWECESFKAAAVAAREQLNYRL